MSCPHCGAEGIEHTPADLAQFTADMTHILASTNPRFDRSRFLAAFINDQPVDMDRVWHAKGQQIDAAEYAFMVAEAAWATAYAPTEPAARPHERVNIKQLAIPF